MPPADHKGPEDEGDGSPAAVSDGNGTRVVDVDFEGNGGPPVAAGPPSSDPSDPLVGAGLTGGPGDGADPTAEMSRAELIEHLKDLLRNGNVAEFNRLRPPDKIDLSGLDVRGRNLDGVDFRDCDLTRAVLQGTSLRGALFQHAILNHANLQNTTLDGANLFDIEAAHLDLRNVRSAVRADFRTAQMYDSNFSGGTGLRLQRTRKNSAQTLPDVCLLARHLFMRIFLKRGYCRRTVKTLTLLMRI